MKHNPIFKYSKLPIARVNAIYGSPLGEQAAIKNPLNIDHYGDIFQ